MTNKLTKLLELAYADNQEKKRVLDKTSTKTILNIKENDDTYKALLQSDSRQEANLLQEEVYKTISEGAEPWKCMRDVVPTIRTDSYSVRVVKGETGTYAEKLAEGANVPIDTQVYTKEDISVYKIGTRPLITNELIEDCLFDIVNLELKKAGMRMENKLNRDVLLEILADAGTTEVDPAGSHIAVSDLAKARSDIQTNNYMPDKVVFHPLAEGYLLQDSNLAYVSYAGESGPLHTGNIPKLMGLIPYTTSCTTGTTANVWGTTDQANQYYGVVLDSAANTYLAMRRDLTVEQYDDPIHDIMGISCTMRYGVATVQANAACNILTK